jgi:hypothetical protein
MRVPTPDLSLSAIVLGILVGVISVGLYYRGDTIESTLEQRIARIENETTEILCEEAQGLFKEKDRIGIRKVGGEVYCTFDGVFSSIKLKGEVLDDFLQTARVIRNLNLAINQY